MVAHFAASRLTGAERDEAWRRVGEHYAAWGERLRDALFTAEDGTRFAALSSERENLEAVVTACAGSDPALAARAWTAILPVHLQEGPYARGLALCARLADAQGTLPPELSAALSIGRAKLLRLCGRTEDQSGSV